MLANILLIIFYLVAPAGVLWICRKSKIFGKIGPVLVLYFLGVIVANINIIPESAAGVQDALSSILVPLAIPMMLFACNFKNFSVKQTLKSFIIGIFSVVVMVVVGYFIIGNGLGEEGAIMGAALTGQYTGGAGNLAAVKMMLNLDNTTFILLSTCNLIVSFFYLMFLMSGGVQLARRIIGGKQKRHSDIVNTSDYVDDNPYRDFGKKRVLIQLLKIFGVAALVTVASLGIGKLFKEDYFMIIMILTLTTISLLLSFNKRIKSWDKSYDLGMYLIYIFCFVMASMADLSKIDLISSINILLFQTIIVFGSLFLTIILAKFIKVDADNAVITSDTLINSPICVPMIAATMKNKDVIIVGITNGIAGYAVGNYLAFFLYQILLMI
ncbi:MAG: DUF819 family protein [Bacteroidales bacterium]|nr:DUF819 family protein [Bacteroidales bacterium]